MYKNILRFTKLIEHNFNILTPNTDIKENVFYIEANNSYLVSYKYLYCFFLYILVQFEIV